MTKTMLREVHRAALALAAAGAIAGAAHAQETPVPAGTLTAQAAAESNAHRDALPAPAEPAPAPLASCGAQNCLSVQVSDDGLRALRRGASPADFAKEVTFSYDGAQPVPVYFLAARYENGRLAQYEYTDWMRPEGAATGLTVDGLAQAIVKTALPNPEADVSVVEATRDAPVWTVPVSIQSFMYNSPRTPLIGAPADAALDEATAPADLAAMADTGTFLLLVVATADKNLRAPEQARATGVVAPLRRND